jgi:hypothetical protein
MRAALAAAASDCGAARAGSLASESWPSGALRKVSACGKSCELIHPGGATGSSAESEGKNIDRPVSGSKKVTARPCAAGDVGKRSSSLVTL